jgi:hypothetical protein
MAVFFEVGRQWLNMDLVTGVELMGDQSDPTNVKVARVHYSNGGTQDFQDNQDVVRIKKFLESHRAQ